MPTLTSLLTFGFVILIILAVWLAYVYFSKDDDERRNSFFLNFVSKHSDGHFYGRIISDILGKDGRHFVTYIPKDIFPKRGEKLEIKEQKVIVGKNKLFRFPKGTLSAQDDVTIAWPIETRDIDESVKNTLFGTSLMFITEMQNQAQKEVDILARSSKDKDDLLRRINMGEFTQEWMNFVEERTKDVVRVMASAKDTKDKPSTTTILQPGSVGHET